MSEQQTNLSSYHRNNSTFPSSYRDHCIKSHQAELTATRELYYSIDCGAESRKIERLDDCHKFAWFARNQQSGEVRVQSNHCRLRWCPLCSHIKSWFISHSITEWLETKSAPKLLTLTLRHSGNSLANQISDIYHHFQNFRRVKWIKKAVQGGIWFFQVKYNEKSGDYHPHIHILLDSDFLPQQSLSDTWLKVTSGSYIVDIRTVYNPPKAASYVARYVARPANLADMPIEQRQQVYMALHGRRLAGSWGTGKGVNLTGKPPETDEKWTRIADWQTIRELLNYDPNAKLVVHCWQSGEPLPEDINFRDLEKKLKWPDMNFEKTQQKPIPPPEPKCLF